MSWSIGFIGKTSNVAEALNAESAKLSGASKQEYDASLPHMVGLIQQNVQVGVEPIVKIQASGHGYIGTDGVVQNNQVQVVIERFNGNIV